MSVREGTLVRPPARVLRTFDDRLVITTFDPVHRDAFKRLNMAWLTRYFRVEPIDERVLGNPESEILQHGGDILFAVLDGEVAGTVALKREQDDSFELTKMAVDERYQGRGYGKRLLEEACALAGRRGARQVILYSQRSLVAAIAMYFKYGFTEMPLQNDTRYSRCDIKMQRLL